MTCGWGSRPHLGYVIKCISPGKTMFLWIQALILGSFINSTTCSPLSSLLHLSLSPFPVDNVAPLVDDPLSPRHSDPVPAAPALREHTPASSKRPAPLFSLSLPEGARCGWPSCLCVSLARLRISPGHCCCLLAHFPAPSLPSFLVHYTPSLGLCLPGQRVLRN